MKADRLAVVVLELVLDLSLEDGQVAHRAWLATSHAGPQLDALVEGQRAALHLVPHYLGQRLRHCALPRGR